MYQNWRGKDLESPSLIVDDETEEYHYSVYRRPVSGEMPTKDQCPDLRLPV